MRNFSTNDKGSLKIVAQSLAKLRISDVEDGVLSVIFTSAIHARLGLGSKENPRLGNLSKNILPCLPIVPVGIPANFFRRLASTAYDMRNAEVCISTYRKTQSGR